ncbi:14265_t:CDS:2 [Funneliformis caledonium]|uniref:14265_t:CDS:1 n=1 Tax=Funneliformis caledonium TaxID=1117310 RepID=A0A9N9CTA5_9GLOM|nr:14265_t:CDS:2 [Funneliformis caledonium]
MSNEFATGEWLEVLEFPKIINQHRQNNQAIPICFGEFLKFLNQLRQHTQAPPISAGELLEILNLYYQAHIITLEEFWDILTLQSQCNQAPSSPFREIPQSGQNYQESHSYFEEISQPSQNYLASSSSLGEIPQQGQFYLAPPSSFEEFPQPCQESTFYSLEISGGRLNEHHVESLASSQIHNTAALVNHNDQQFIFENENNHQAFDSQNELEYPQPCQESTFYSQEISGGRPNEPHVEPLASSQIHNTAALVNHNDTLSNNDMQGPDDCVAFDKFNNQQNSKKNKAPWGKEETMCLLIYLITKTSFLYKSEVEEILWPRLTQKIKMI